MAEERDGIYILHVEDDPDFADLTVDMLELEDERFTVETAHSAEEGLERLAETSFDCIVSDYNMPGRNGIEFLEVVREEYPDLPFILYTGKGSEAVASEAISAGVSDYLQKGTGSEQYELLANRIDTAVSQHRTERKLERQNDLFAKAQDIANIGAWEYELTDRPSHLTDELMRIHGLTPDTDLLPDDSIEYYHPDDQPTISEAFTQAVEAGDSYDLELRFIPEQGDKRWVRTQGEPQFEGGEVVRVRGILQDITERKRREERLKQKNERLEEFTRVVSHDIRTPLQTARDNLVQAKQTGSEEAFQNVQQAHDRMETIIDDVLTLAQQGQDIGTTETVDIDTVAREAWDAVDTANSTLTVLDGSLIEANPDRVRTLFENLFTNAVDHGGETVTVTVGPIEPFATSTRSAGDQPRGFYIEDDGPGIPEDKREEVFDAGYSTTQDGTGFGLSIVKRLVEAHNWQIEITDSNSGGARFEITGA